MKRRQFLHTVLAGGALASRHAVFGDGRGGLPDARTRVGAGTDVRARERGPIIDVHMHGYPGNVDIPASLTNSATGRPPGVTNGEAHLQVCLAEMKRLNILTGVVSGGDGDRLAVAMHWHDTAPDRIIAAAGIRGSEEIPLPDIQGLRKAFAEGRLRVLGEVTAQYAGLTLSDPVYDSYLALAAELNIPVAVHMGMGPAGISYDPCCRGFRARLGNPEVLEECLNRHPTLRLNVMHGGWPYLEGTLAVLKMYPQVFTDVGWINWGLPRREFHQYLGALMRAGFGKRVLFGSDQMYWPEAIGLAVDGVDSATFLTPAEKRDVFYGNAMRFLQLGQEGDRKRL